MSISTEQVLHLAKLARLELKEGEIVRVKSEISDILDYLNQLLAVPTKGVVPTSHVHGVVNVFRDDFAKQSLPLDAVQANAPDFDQLGFRVPKIIE